MITTSGRLASTALSAASASPASATTVMPPTPSRMLLSPRRTSSWSSQSMIRIAGSSGTSALYRVLRRRPANRPAEFVTFSPWHLALVDPR